MNFVKRSLVSIVSDIGTNIVTLLVIFVLGCVMSGAISTNIALHDASAGVTSTLPAIVTIGIDHDSQDEYMRTADTEMQFATIGYDLLAEIGTLPQVARFDFPVLTTLLGCSTEFEIYLPPHPDGEAVVNISSTGYTALDLKGVQSTFPIDVSEGIVEITQGRMFTEAEIVTFSEVAIISENFAHTNSLGIGSTMLLEKVAWTIPGGHDTAHFAGRDDVAESDIAERRSYNLEVVGIYNSLTEFNTGNEYWDWHLRVEAENFIYVPNVVARDVDNWFKGHMAVLHPNDPWFAAENNPEDLYLFQNLYVLHDIGELDNFRQAVAEIAPPFVVVIDPIGNSVNVNSSMNALGELTNSILTIAIIASIFILSLLIILSMRERRKEVGIYLALGERRARIVGQMLLEVAAIAFVAITLSLAAGNVFAGNISQGMLQDNLAIVANDGFGGREHNERSLERIGMTPQYVAVETLEAYDASLDSATIFTFYAIAMLVIIISIIIPMLYILRLNPRKIMM